MHAVLITAYKDFPALLRLVTRLDPSFFKLFVHIDARSSLGTLEIERLRSLNCEVCKIYPVRWGTFGHLRAIMHLLEQAVARGEVDYVHIISGQDYPLVRADEFARRCDGRIFLNFSPLDAEPDYTKDRYRLRNYFHWLQGASRVANRLHRYLDGTSRWAQRSFAKPRLRVGPYDKIYKGLVWSSFPAHIGRRLLDDDQAKKLLEATRTTYLPEEIFLQTYLLNSERGLVLNDCLRFMDWENRNGSIPAFLDESDIEALSQSDALFARKVSSEVSGTLLDWIDRTRFGEP